MKRILAFTSMVLISLLSACSDSNSQLPAQGANNQNIISGNPQKDGEDFLAKKKTEQDIKSLASGLMYKIIKTGNGRTPKATDSVTTNYRGTFVDGKEFDSSYKTGEPATFPVNGVIKGWTEALQLMKEGDKWELYIPSNLAYGESGNSPVIPGNSALVFELELIKVN